MIATQLVVIIIAPSSYNMQITNTFADVIAAVAIEEELRQGGNGVADVG